MQEIENNQPGNSQISPRRRNIQAQIHQPEASAESAANLAGMPRDGEPRNENNNLDSNTHRHIRQQSGQYIYDVNAFKFYKCLIDIGLSALIYSGLALMWVLVIMIDKMDTTGMFREGINPRWALPLVILSITAITVALLTGVNIKVMPRIQILTTLDIVVYVMMATVFYGVGIKCQMLLALIFGILYSISGLLGVIIGICYLENKSDILTYIIATIQLALIGGNADGIFSNISWSIILIGVMALGACGFIFSFLFIKSIISYYNRPEFELAITSYIWKSLQCFGLALTCGWIVFRALSTQDPFWFTLTCFIYHLLIGIYMLRNVDPLALFEADADPVADLGKQINIAFEKEVKESVFYRLAENWLSDDRKEAEKRADGKSVSEQNIGGELRKRDSVSGGNECTVCLTDRLAFMWMPCGHLTVCEGCAKYLMDNKKLECLICKAPCTSIYHISELTAVGSKSKSDYLYKVEEK